MTKCGAAQATSTGIQSPAFGAPHTLSCSPDLERCALRPGNVHCADGWEAVLKPVVARYRSKVSRIYFRADAGFANPDVYEYLEAEKIKYAIRLPANRVLRERIGHLLKRPAGRPSNDVRRSYANFTYQAGSRRRLMPARGESSDPPSHSSGIIVLLTSKSAPHPSRRDQS
jgi:hypothetical protein